MALRKGGKIGVSLAALLLASAGVAQDSGLFGPNDQEIRVLGQVSDPSVRKATAMVNGEVITDTDIEHRLNLVLMANKGVDIPDEERARLRLQILRNLIDEKLQIQEAKSNDISISDAEIDQAFARVAGNFRMKPPQLEVQLTNSGTSAASLKQQIRAEIYWSRLLRRKVEPFVNVGDDEVQAIIAKLEASKGQNEYHVGEIFLSATPETSPQIMEGARRIAEQVRKGASFRAYARQFSEASTAGLGGDLDWVRPEQLSPQMQNAILSLKKGEVSEPIQVPGGVLLVTLFEQRKVLAASPSDAILSLKQISLKLKPGTTPAQGKAEVARLQKITSGMGGCGRAEQIAQEIGGEVVARDQIVLGTLPEPLQPILEKLRVGEVTPPFGSLKEGLSVLVLCGRDEPESRGPNFDQIYEQLNGQRVEMMAQRYLRDLRRDAIIDYR